MKKLTLAACALLVLGSAAFAGTETYSSSKNMAASAPCPTWYADNEWNIGISGIYAPTTNSWIEDRYIGRDHVWGGAVDIKYFFRRYFGVGVQGFGLARSLDTDNGGFFNNDDFGDFVGGVVGTFTFRYPIPCTRFAPYAWVGIGGLFGDAVRHVGVPFGNGTLVVPVRDEDHDDALMGQYGFGLEYRFTQHIGATVDASYNQVERSNNDFWQIRGGLNFAF